MNKEIVKKSENQSEEQFKVGQIIALSLKGHYHIDSIESLDFGGTSQDVYVLSHIADKTIHKTFLPKKSASKQGARKLVDANELSKMGAFLNGFELSFEPLKHNSNKKMIAYDKRVKENGFWAMVETYLNVDHDIKETKREDKRYVAFLERLFELITLEISCSLSCDIEEAQDLFSSAIKKVISH